MNRKMRRFKQELSEEMTKEILERNTSGVLALVGDEGYPYGVPISYAYDGDKAIYFHSAVAGYKTELIEKNHKASFTVIDKDQVVGAEVTTYFRSAIATGKIALATDDETKRTGLDYIWKKYSFDFEDRAKAEIEDSWKRIAIYKLDIEELRGKEAIELVKEREGK